MQCVSRYCAIQGRQCEKDVPDHQGRCCFVAYPFQQPFEDIAREVERNLSLQGYRMEVPRASRSATGLLFCDNVCPMISKANLVLGEVTVLNHNVFFELGYACGLRKPVLLMRNTGLKHEVNAILNSGIYINHYRTSQDVVTAVVSNDAGHTWPVLFNDDSPVQSDTVAVLTPEHEYHKQEIGRAIRRRIADHRLTVIEETGAQIDLLRKFRAIQSAEWVVGDLVSDNVTDSHALNSETAFLLGMAVSLQKKVIVLQEEPVGKPMIDLAGLLARYTGIDSLMHILAERLDVIVRRTIDRFDDLFQPSSSDTRELGRLTSDDNDASDEVFARWSGEPDEPLATTEPEDDASDTERDDGLAASLPNEDFITPTAVDDDLSLATDDSSIALDDEELSLASGDSELELTLDEDAADGSQVISLDGMDGDDGDDFALALDEDNDPNSDSGSQVIALDESDTGSEVVALDDEEADLDIFEIEEDETA